MAGTEFKKLLAKISLDTGDFQQNVKKLKATLDDLYQQEKKKTAEQQRALESHSAAVKANAQKMKEVSDQQLTASKKQIEALNQTKQAFTEITQASVKLKAQTDLEAISANTVLKKRQGIVAQCEIEMEKLTRLRNPLVEQSRLLQQITTERQRQLALIEKEELATAKRVPVMTAANLQTGTTRPQAVESAAANAAFALRLKMNQATALTEGEILAERQKIVALADKEIATLTAKQTLTKEERSQLASVLTIREGQTRAIQQQQLAQDRMLTTAHQQAIVENQRRKIAASRNVVSAEEQKISEIRLQLSRLAAGQESKAVQLHEAIAKILDQQIEEIRAKNLGDRENLTTVNRLIAAREREANAIRQARIGKGEAAGGADVGFIGRWQRHLAGTFGLGEVAGGVFTGAVAAEVTIHMFDSMMEKIKELSGEADRLQPVQDAFERLGKIRGVDTIQFLGQLRDATHDLIGDAQLMAAANAVMQSSLNVGQSQIVEMVHDTVALARAHNANKSSAAAATEAIDALTRSFSMGRFETLAYVTGISQADMGIRSIGRGMPAIVRSTEQFGLVLDALHRKMLLTGDPAITLGERFQILKVEQDRFFEAFYRSLTQTQGFHTFLAFVDDVLVNLRKGEEVGKGWGERLGPVFVGLTTFARTLGQVLKDLWGTFSALTDIIGTTISGFATLSDAMGVTTGRASALNQMFSGPGNFFISLEEGIGVAVSGVELLVQALAFLSKEMWQLSTSGIHFVEGWRHPWQTLKNIWGGISGEWQHFKGQVKEGNDSLDDFADKMEAARAQLAQGSKPVPVTKGVNVPASALLPPPDPQFAIQQAKLRMQLQEALDKEYLANAKESLQEERDANEEAYAGMEKSFADYIQKKKELRAADLQATLLEAQQDRDAKLAEIKFEEELAVGPLRQQMEQAAGQAAGGEGITDEQRAAAAQNLSNLKAELALAGSTYEIRKKIIEAQYQGTTVRAKSAEQQAQQQLNDQLIKDSETAARTRAQAELKIETSGLQDQQTALKDHLDEGLVSANEYIKARKEQIEQERVLTIAALFDEYSHMADTLDNEAKMQAAMQEANEKARKDNLKLDLDADDLRMQSAEKAYERISKLLSTQAKIAETPRGQALLGMSEVEILEKEIALTDRYIAQQMEIAATMDHNELRYQKILEDIAGAQEQQEQYNERLREARDILSPIGNLLDKLGGAFGAFHQKGLAEVAEGLRAGGATFQAVAEARKSAFDNLREQSDRASGSVHGFAGAITNATSAIGSFIQMLGGSRAVEHRAGGGPVYPGGSYWVGEKGPELFSPDAAGTIMPRYASGTWNVPRTGPAFLEAGEAVLPTHVLDELANVVKSLTSTFETLGNSVSALTSHMTSGVFGTAPGATPPNLQADILGVPFGAGFTGSPVSAFLQAAGYSPGSPSAPDSGGGFGGAISGVQKFVEMLAGQGEGQGVGAVKQFVSTLTGAVGAVGSFIQSTAGAQTTTSGLVGGALSGLSLGSNFGPIGAAIGAAAGGIFGAISGQKNEKIQEQIQALINEFNQVVQQLNQGVLGLNQAIQQAQAVAQQIQRQPTGKKGSGQSAKQQALQQAEQTLQQLQEKQNQVLQQLQQQLDNLRVPTGYQQWLGSIEQILQQYDQFANAAQNVQQLAQAQEYLTEALQQYATTEATQVQSAEITAIQNGINLNNLYIQRQQLMEQYSQQVQGIMAGGVAVREVSASASKAAQLQQAQIGYDQQMDQLNMQISVSQYQYETQQKIYGLATTRVGLEMQLLTLQESQTDQQNASNAALLNIVNVIRSTPASQLATTPQLMAALGLPYSGPTAGQVGPQIGQLGSAGTPAQFLQTLLGSSEGKTIMQKALGTTSLSSITQAQEQQVIDFIQTYAQTNYSSALNNLYGQLQSVLTGAPATQFSALYPVAPLYPAQGSSATVPWEYGGGMAPYGQPTTSVTNPLTGQPTSGSTAYGVPPESPSAEIQTSASAGTTSPIYYLSDPTTNVLTPVYNTPTAALQSGVGFAQSMKGGAAATTATPTAGANQIPFVYSGSPSAVQQAASYGFTGTTLPANLTLYGTDQNGNPVYTDQDGNLYDASGQQIGSVAASGSFTVQGMGTSGYYTTPSQTVPMNTIPGAAGQAGLGSTSGATTTLQDLLQYPGLGEQGSANISLPGEVGGTSLAAGTAVLPAGQGPSSAPTGPVILSGSSNPFAYGNLLGSTTVTAPPAGGTSTTTLPPLPSGPVGTPPTLVAPISTLTSTSVGTAATNQAQTTLNAAKVSTEQQVSSIAMTRIGAETKLLQMRQQQNQNDLQVIKAYQQLQNSISGSGTSISNLTAAANAVTSANGVRYGGKAGAAAPTIEDNLYDLYRERGRYGEGGIAGQYP